MKFHQKEVKQQREKHVAAALAVCSRLEMHFSGSSMDAAWLGRGSPGPGLSLCKAPESGIYLCNQLWASVCRVLP